MIYAIVFIGTLLISCRFKCYTSMENGLVLKKYKKSYFYIVSIVLLFIIACRGIYVGSDTRVYKYYFDLLSSYSFADVIEQYLKNEVVFFTLTWITNKTLGNFQFFLLIAGMFYILPVSALIRKKSDNAPMSYFLFYAFGFYTFALSTVKQAIAMGICLVAYLLNENNKKLLSFILILFAASFHWASLVALPILFLDKIKLKKIYIILMAILPVIILVGYNKIVALFNMYAVAHNGAAYITTKTGGYGMIAFLAICVSLGIYYYYCISDLRQDLEFSKLIFMLYIAMILFIATRFNMAAMRLYNYYFIFVIIYIPKLLNNIKNKNSKILLSLMFVVIALYFLFFQVFDDPMADSRRLLPYYFFWNEV